MALIPCLAFLPGVFGGFVGWDDDRNFLRNHAYRGLGWSQLRWMFTTWHMGHYKPLTWLTLGLDYTLWGMNPGGYHLTSLALHTANAVLFLFVARRLLAAALGTPPRSSLSPAGGEGGGEASLRIGAVGAALLFAVHPLRVESVVWITERRDVLSGFFYLLTVLAYLRWAAPARAERGAEAVARRRWYWAALALFAAALLAKSMVVTLPAVLLILDVYPLGRLGRGRTAADLRSMLVEKIPFFLLSAVTSIVAFLALVPLRNAPSLAEFPLLNRLAVSVYGLAFYLWKTLIPFRLSPLYEVPLDLDPLGRVSLLSGAVVLAITGVALALWRRWPALAAVWGTYVLTCSPVLGIFQNGPQIAADRYTYLSCLGWALLVGAGLSRCATRWASGGPRRHAFGAALGATTIALVVLGGLSARQSLVWHDSLTLWSHALAIDPGSPRAHTGLAAGLLLDEGNPQEAERHLEQAVALEPTLPEALIGLAITRRMSGRTEEALSYAARAVVRTPYHAGIRYEAGHVFKLAGRPEQALVEFRESARLDPGDPLPRAAIATTAAELGRMDEATAALAEARRLAYAMDPGDADGDRFEARVYAKADPQRAIRAWQRYFATVGTVRSPSRQQASGMMEGLTALDDLEKKSGAGLGDQ